MEDARIGIYVCWCGSNIAKMVDVERLSKDLKELPNVVVSKDYKYMCSDPGQDLIIQDIKEHNLNRIVVAACSPRIHELTFRKALENAGLNPYLFEMANIREHVSWVHNDKEVATQKAKALIAAAATRVKYHEPLTKRSAMINPASLIIGGGVTGMTAAIEIANSGNKVFLVEKDEQLGGALRNFDVLYPELSNARQLLTEKLTLVENDEKIVVYTRARIESITGYIGNFEAEVEAKGNKEKIQFGNIIVATGLNTFDPAGISEYGYRKFPEVLTSTEFEWMLKQDKIETPSGVDPKHITIIHCVGSRNQDSHPYCSRVCCSTALKYIERIRDLLPETHIYDLYADMRAFGRGCEELYTKASSSATMMIMFDQAKDLPEVKKAAFSDPGMLSIEFHELLSNEDVRVPADLVVLMTGMEARDDAKEVGHLVGISMCGNDFFIEKHPKLDPVATTTDGVYIAGTCQGPKGVLDSVSQARAAAARVLASISMEEVEVEVATACVNEEMCCGCQTCLSVCPYTAISYKEDKNVSYVNEILCKGCGTCGSACPTGAISSRHFTDQQIMSQIEGLMTLQEV